MNLGEGCSGAASPQTLRIDCQPDPSGAVVVTVTTPISMYSFALPPEGVERVCQMLREAKAAVPRIVHPSPMVPR